MLSVVNLVPSWGMSVEYIVLDCLRDELDATAGWRHNVKMKSGESLVDRHWNTYQSQRKNILAGDGLDNVSVAHYVRSYTKYIKGLHWLLK